ncbi:MAG TPA: hypothetical protein VLL27_05785 [Solirubrobacterales bacterium]|nr:hypothetical protein [Solirubrobacterales bacterium]
MIRSAKPIDPVAASSARSLSSRRQLVLSIFESLDQIPEVVAARNLDLPHGEHSLQRLLDSLLEMEADHVVGLILGRGENLRRAEVLTRLLQ